MKNTQQKKISPWWAWVPSLYLAEGLPYVAVQLVSVIMYKRMGMSNTNIAFYTSLLYLPWIIKPLWSPFVDLLKTKRWWIFTMQLLLGAGFAGIAFTIPLPFFFKATMAFFYLLAFSSATHDIAADGFYMLALDAGKQAEYVGIRSTFYRIATLMGQGALIIVAGFLETHNGAEPLKIQIEASSEYTQNTLFIPEVLSISELPGDKIKFLTDREVLNISTKKINEGDSLFKKELDSFVKEIKALNIENKFVKEDQEEKILNLIKKKPEISTPDIITEIRDLDASDVKKTLTLLQKNKKIARTGSQKDNQWIVVKKDTSHFEKWIIKNFGEDRSKFKGVGNIGVVAVYLSKKPEAGKEMILNTSSDDKDPNISLIHGERLVFNEKNWNKPAYMIFQADSKLTGSTKEKFTGLSGNIPFAWSITFFILAVLFIVFGFYHKFILPKPDSDKHHAHLMAKTILKEFFVTFASFFQKPQVVAAVFFMLTFRFAEAQLLKLINPFLLDPKNVGGLGLTTGQVGLYYGTIGMIAITLGGILGGIVAAKGGLKKWLWPMSFSMILTAGTFVFLGITQNDNFWVVNACICIEQFGYGFGFTAYMLYMMYFSQGKHKTAHYAICTGFMALGMTLPGMFAGWLQELLGYRNFFIWVMICAIIPIIAVSLLKIDSEYGKKKVNQ